MASTNPDRHSPHFDISYWYALHPRGLSSPAEKAYMPGQTAGLEYCQPVYGWQLAKASQSSNAFGWRQTPDLQGGPERATERVPRTQHVDWHAEFPNEILISGSAASKQVALTFDDGPDDIWTPQILDLLLTESVEATFFCVGQRIEAHPAVFKRIIDEGHIVGNHTYSHPNLSKIPAVAIRDQVERTNIIIQKIAGVTPRWMRPPYGALSRDAIEVMVQLHMKIVYWNVDSLDWNGLTGPQVAANVLSHAGPGSIILMHSAGGIGESLVDTVQALPYIIRILKSEGYSFVTPGTMANEKPYLSS